MRKPIVYFAACITVAVAIIVIVLIALLLPEPRIEDILSAYQDQVQYNGLTISYPFDDTFFPPEIVSPTFHWKDSNTESNTWLITVKFQDDKGRMNFLTHCQQWKPEPRYWEIIKNWPQRTQRPQR